MTAHNNCSAGNVDLDELQSDLTDSLKPQGELRPLCLKAAEAIAYLRRAVPQEAPEPVAWAILHVNCDGIWKLTDDKDSADYWERSGFPVQPLAPLSLSRPHGGGAA